MLRLILLFVGFGICWHYADFNSLSAYSSVLAPVGVLIFGLLLAYKLFSGKGSSDRTGGGDSFFGLDFGGSGCDGGDSGGDCSGD
ncbi:hypothetical protein TERTU_0089 [Teredinibacter turnerae T7901]|uniref:Uncharacterized protein n=1 Tax=Teredinibacter turnerae (strain ATCC 39867 / T7901) TaxID=377629 RepID=C5BKU8_TERTT|nr:hypothetical protein [Teredinibacter turnerae]ACR11595.1 hypothetical protein TERTU_0089 [Teredinibacter turnerae T7901]